MKPPHRATSQSKGVVFFIFFFFTGFLPCFRIFCFLYLCGSPPVNRLGPRSAVAVVVSVVMFVCSTQVRRETLGLIGVCFSKVWLLFYSCGLPFNGSASPFTTKIGGSLQSKTSLTVVWVDIPRHNGFDIAKYNHTRTWRYRKRRTLDVRDRKYTGLGRHIILLKHQLF